MAERKTDILIVGGGTGGCAAAMSATSMGYRVIMTEETDWIGGQLTSQAVPPDEHRWIESHGCTQRYRQYRNGVRNYYRDHYPLTPEARENPHLNPGGGTVSRICHEPRVGLAVLEAMLAAPQSRGLLEILLNRKPLSADTDGDVVRAVTFKHLHSGDSETITADYILDATELGDMLPLAGVDYVTGAESQDETGEPHAVSGPAQPENVQAISWCFSVSYDADGDHTIDCPEQYSFWRDYTPPLTPAWSGKLLDWSYSHPQTLEPTPRTLLPEEDGHPLWLFRRITATHHYPHGVMPREVTLVNWPQIDYMEGNIIDKPQETVEKYLGECRELSLSFLYWMQTEAPRVDGGVGYPGLYLRPDIVGTDDGLAKYPYIRESRRIKARFTVTENHVGTDAREGKPAKKFDDSVGVGCYRIDLHPSTEGVNYIDISSLPFQIPLGALVPCDINNLLPACKNIGTTHITNGCYRLHPVEWNIGEASGALAAFCLSHNTNPQKVLDTEKLFGDFQKLLHSQGVETSWPSLTSV